MLRIITLNLNGIRSALAKGFPRWLARQRADLVCLQEIKAQEADLADLALIPRGISRPLSLLLDEEGLQRRRAVLPSQTRECVLRLRQPRVRP